MGTINLETREFKTTRKTPQHIGNARWFTVWKWFWEAIIRNQIPYNCKVSNMNRCSCCGRPLTDETSVRIGYGPVCRKELGISEDYAVEPYQLGLYKKS